MMRESDILFEAGRYWVLRQRDQYTVMQTGLTHSTSDSAYEKTPDGLSIAIARCSHLHKRTQS